MTNSEKPNGLMFPTQSSYPPGAGNPNQAALISTQDNAVTLDKINKLAGGKKYKMKKTKTLKKTKKYRGGAVTVPQMQMLYTPKGGPGTNPNAQITGLSEISTQDAVWREADNHAKMGGSTKRKTGGNPNWDWPCMSGGKKKMKKSRKHRKSRRSKRSKHSRRNKY